MGKKIVLIEDGPAFVEAWRSLLSAFFPSVSFLALGKKDVTLLRIAELASEEWTYFVFDNQLWEGCLSGQEMARMLVDWGFPIEKVILSSADNRDLQFANIGKIEEVNVNVRNTRYQAFLVTKFLEHNLKYSKDFRRPWSDFGDMYDLADGFSAWEKGHPNE